MGSVIPSPLVARLTIHASIKVLADNNKRMPITWEEMLEALAIDMEQADLIDVTLE